MVAPLEPGIVCADIESMLRFYSELLGFEMVSDAEATAEMSAQFGASPFGYRIVRLQTPCGERIKLVQTKGPAKLERVLPKWIFERNGLAYLTFIVSDVGEVAARLRANGVRLINQEPMEVRKGFHALFASDPEGNYVEFVQYADLASYRPDLQDCRSKDMK
jgi:catechol 2,3-dioxygenase-like lactoylglutathione lyase family enzyme